MQKIVSFFLILIFITSFTTAQQEVQFSQYFLNPYYLNPAASGLTNTAQFDLGFRKQWMNIEGAPLSFYLMGNSQIKLKKSSKKVLDEFNLENESIYSNPSKVIGSSKHIIGGKMLSDQLGPFIKNSAVISYAYHLRFTKNTMLGAGFSIGMGNLFLNSNKIVLYEEDDAQYTDFLVRNANQNIIDGQIGVILYGKRSVFGLSATHLFARDLIIDEIITQSNYERNYTAVMTYEIPLESFSLEPHILMQLTRNAPISLNLGTRLIVNNRYWGNISYRLGDGGSFGAGLNFGAHFRIGYVFDLGLGAVQNMSSNGHELSIGYIVGSKRNIDKEIKEGLEEK